MEFIQQHKKSIIVLIGSAFLFGAGYVSGGVIFASTLYKDMVRNEIHKEMNQLSKIKGSKRLDSPIGSSFYNPTHISLPAYTCGSGEKFPNLFVEILMGIKEKIDDISNRLTKENKNDY